jgi:hypothetical protein
VSRAPLSRGRPVSALFITVGAVFGAVYAASVPAPAEVEPARLTIVAPPSASAPAAAAVLGQRRAEHPIGAEPPVRVSR